MDANEINFRAYEASKYLSFAYFVFLTWGLFFGHNAGMYVFILATPLAYFLFFRGVPLWRRLVFFLNHVAVTVFLFLLFGVNINT